MRKIELYNNEKTYMFPSGEIAPPERMIKDFPGVTAFKHLIETDESGEVCYAVLHFSATKTYYNIPQDIPDAEAIAAIEEILNTPPPEPEASAEERIAAALEFQNLLSM